MVPAVMASLNKHYTNTHDRFFRTCFNQEGYAKELLEFWLPQSIQNELEIANITKQESSLPTIGKEADLLFRGELKYKTQTPGYILLEHKHQRDPKNTYNQIANYGVAIRHGELSQSSKKRAVVLNCIFYHGKDPWHKGGKQGFDSVMYDVGAASMDPVLLKFYVFDLARLGTALWPKKGVLRSILYALLKVPQMGDRVRTEGQDFFRHFLYHLDREDTINLLPSVVSYIADVSNLNYKEVLDMAKSSEAKNLSFLENWEKIMGNPWKEDGRKQGLETGLKKGLEQGLKRGRAEERVAVAANMLKEGFNIPIIEKATGLSQDEIKGIKKG